MSRSPRGFTNSYLRRMELGFSVAKIHCSSLTIIPYTRPTIRRPLEITGKVRRTPAQVTFTSSRRIHTLANTSQKDVTAV